MGGRGVVARRPCLAGTRRGAQGGVACLPFALALFLPPSPRPPSRREGGDLKFSYARGFAPCIPGAEPGRHRLFLWKAGSGGGLRPLRGGVRGGVAVPGGGRRGASPADLATVVPGGGLAFLVAFLPFYFSLLSFPHPPDPLPLRGRGRFKVYFAGGYRPRHPCNRVGSGTGFSCGKRVPLVITAVQGIQSLAGLDAALVSNGGSQGEGGPGERNFGV